MIKKLKLFTVLKFAIAIILLAASYNYSMAAMSIPKPTIPGPAISRPVISTSPSIVVPPMSLIPSITYINPASGFVGLNITITGTKFTPTVNDIKFTKGDVTGYLNRISSNGTSITFTIPEGLTACPSSVDVCTRNYIVVTPGTYSLSVVNSNGTSNAVDFTVTPSPLLSPSTISPLTTGPVVTPTNISNDLRITTNPHLQSAVVGSQYSTTIAATGGSDSYAWNISEGALPTGLTLFSPVCVRAPCKVPTNITGIPTSLGDYTFKVTVTSGVHTYSSNFVMNVSKVTPPVISDIPTSGPIGIYILIRGSGFTPTDNSVRFGNGYKNGLRSSANGTLMTFTIPHGLGVCLPETNPCPDIATVVTPGNTYPISVINSNGTSNSVDFTVAIAPVITSILPISGPIGTSVTITGSNFTPTDNRVHFSNDGIIDEISSNGTSITFKLPKITHSTDFSIVTKPGTYSLRVRNTNGASNAVDFTVTEAPVVITPPIDLPFGEPTLVSPDFYVKSVGYDTDAKNIGAVICNQGGNIGNSKGFFNYQVSIVIDKNDQTVDSNGKSNGVKRYTYQERQPATGCWSLVVPAFKNRGSVKGLNLSANMNHELRIYVDSSDKIKESNESNNELIQTLYVGQKNEVVAPDVYIKRTSFDPKQMTMITNICSIRINDNLKDSNHTFNVQYEIYDNSTVAIAKSVKLIDTKLFRTDQPVNTCWDDIVSVKSGMNEPSLGIENSGKYHISINTWLDNSLESAESSMKNNNKVININVPKGVAVSPTETVNPPYSPWELVSGDPKDTCTHPTYSGEVNVRGSYIWATAYVEKSWVFQIVASDVDKLPIKEVYNSDSYNGWKNNRILSLLGASPELITRLKAATQAKPVAFTIRGFSAYCEGAPQISINSPAIKPQVPQVYKNTKFNFSFRYPTGVKLDCGGVGCELETDSYVSFHDNIIGNSKINIGDMFLEIMPNANNLSLQQLYDKSKGFLPSNITLAFSSSAKVGGLPAITVMTKNLSELSALLCGFDLHVQNCTLNVDNQSTQGNTSAYNHTFLAFERNGDIYTFIYPSNEQQVKNIVDSLSLGKSIIDQAINTSKIIIGNQIKTAPQILIIKPESGKVGSNVVITGNGFTSTGNRIKFGDLGSENNPIYNINSADGQTLNFAVPASNYLSCWDSNPACLAPATLTQPGAYKVSVINSNGTSNEILFNVVTSPVTLRPENLSKTFDVYVSNQKIGTILFDNISNVRHQVVRTNNVYLGFDPDGIGGRFYFGPGQIWKVSPGAKTMGKLSFASGASSISPDEKKFASRTNSDGINSTNTLNIRYLSDGTEDQKITFEANEIVGDTLFSPNSDKIAVQIYESTVTNSLSIYIIDLSTGEKTFVVRKTTDFLYFTGWKNNNEVNYDTSYENNMPGNDF